MPRPETAVQQDRPRASVRWYRREPLLLAACIALLLLATVPPLINLGRFQHRIASAISRSLGRPVGMDAISLRLLPWPAFEIQNLVVAEDPAFGAEPALRAPEVIAELRLSSLWRGHFELSRVELTDASVNLVHAADGRWSVGSILLQASHIPNAPTAQARAGAAPRFPYIQATGARINLKQGVEKLPYSLLNADFAMWLARPEVWQLRLEGQPVRTDLELSLGDTGLLRVEGELHHASAFGAMPLQLTAEWSHAPLGQLSRLLLGRDAGWRGDIDATGAFAGEINHLDVRSHLVVSNLHRQEFTPEQPVTLDATCRTAYSRSQPALDATSCRWPLGDGALVLARAATTPAGGTIPAGAVTLTAEKVPASFLVQLLSLARAGAPNPSGFSGLVDGTFSWDPALRQLSGAATMPSLAIDHGAVDGTPLVITGLALRAAPGSIAATTPGPLPRASTGRPGRQEPTKALAPASASGALTGHPGEAPVAFPLPQLLFSADAIPMGIAGAPLTLSAELSSRGYTLHASGSAALPTLAAAARALHLPGPAHLTPLPVRRLSMPQASVQLALSSAGNWLGGDAGQAIPLNSSGSIHLQNVVWEPVWLPTPIAFASADLTLASGSLRWATAAATLGEPPQALRFSGTAQVPLGCVPGAACVTEVALATGTLDAGALQSVLGGAHQPLISSLLRRIDPGRLPLPPVQGTVHAGLLTLGRLPITDATITFTTRPDGAQADDSAAARASIDFTGVNGRALGGTLHMEGSLLLAGDGPQYALKAELAGAKMAEAGALWHENWGSGTLAGSATLTCSGSSAGDLLRELGGSFRASWTGGGLAHAAPVETAGSRASLPPALEQFASWDAAGTLSPSGVAVRQGTLAGGPATLQGTLGWDRSLALRFTPSPTLPGATTPGEAPLLIGGTLAAPSVAAAPAQ